MAFFDNVTLLSCKKINILNCPSNRLSLPQQLHYFLCIFPLDLEDESGVTEGDVQKKVIPWRSMFPEEEEEDEEWAGPDKGKKKHLPGGLIVVTSLIDKVPNLGGKLANS